MSLEIKGRIVRIFDSEAVSPTFTVRKFWVEHGDTSFAQINEFQLTQDYCALLDKYNIGDVVTVKLNLRGKTYAEGQKVFNSLNAWKIEGIGAQQPAPQSQPAAQADDAADIFGTAPAPAQAPTLTEQIESEDLPF